MTKATVRLFDGYRTTITSRQHTYHADESIPDGGTDTAPDPTEMLMGALGSCVALTMKLYAQRKKWALEGIEIALDYERFAGKDYPDYEGEEQFIHEIRENIVLHGNLTDEQKERLLEIASKCPVTRIIATPTFWKQNLLDMPITE
jgi:putative redox protein